MARRLHEGLLVERLFQERQVALVLQAQVATAETDRDALVDESVPENAQLDEAKSLGLVWIRVERRVERRRYGLAVITEAASGAKKLHLRQSRLVQRLALNRSRNACRVSASIHIAIDGFYLR